MLYDNRKYREDWFKRFVCVILSAPTPWKNGNPRFTTVPLKRSDKKRGWKIPSCFIMIISPLLPISKKRANHFCRETANYQFEDTKRFILNQTKLLSVPLWIGHCLLGAGRVTWHYSSQSFYIRSFLVHSWIGLTVCRVNRQKPIPLSFSLNNACNINHFSLWNIYNIYFL